MSQKNFIKDVRGSFDPGGSHERMSSPPLQWDQLSGESGFDSRVATDGDQIDSIDPKLWLSSASSLHSECRPNFGIDNLKISEQDDLGSGRLTLSRTKPDDTITIDSGCVCGSILSGEEVAVGIPDTPKDEHRIYREPSTAFHTVSILDGTPTLPLDNDSGVAMSLELAPAPAAQLSSDFGYESLQSADYSSFGSSMNSDADLPVKMRVKSHQLSARLSSENPVVSHRHVLLHNKSGSCHEDSPHKRLRDYAMRMNYSESEFEQCLFELGGEVKDIDSDKLLRHLVKIRESNRHSVPQTATASKKRLSSSKSVSHLKSEADSKGLRRIVIDGSNVAMEHGNHQIYSCRGIEIVVNYFQERGHEHITVFVPAHRLKTEHRETIDQHILNALSKRGVVVKTPSRRSSKGNIASYEDRFILKLASMDEAIVVSNDHFRDLKGESSAFRETIEKRILPFVFANDQFIPAEDPLGKRGPTLEQFLRVDPFNTNSGACPYGRKCTYGTKCKFGHPERVEGYDSALGDSVKSGLYTSSGTSGDGMTSRTHNADSWTSTSRSKPFDQYAAGKYLSSGNHYSYMVNSSTAVATQPLISSRQQPFYQPIDSGNGGLHYQRSSTGFSQDYPPARHSYHPRPASSAHLHMTENQSYFSVPLEDSFQGIRHPAPLMQSSLGQLLPASVKVTARSASGSQSGSSPYSSDVDSSSAPQPLNENISSTSTQYPTHLLPGRAPPQQYTHPHNAPILREDPRYNIYFHLKNLFPEKVVRRVMNKHPKETDPNKITAAVLELQIRMKTPQVDC